MSRTIMNEVMSTERVFDEEDPATVGVLNEASAEIGHFMVGAGLSRATLLDLPLVREATSTSIDHLQAADLAAGWAREALETSDVTALARRFARVWVNGTLFRDVRTAEAPRARF